MAFRGFVILFLVLLSANAAFTKRDVTETSTFPQTSPDSTTTPDATTSPLTTTTLAPTTPLTTTTLAPTTPPTNTTTLAPTTPLTTTTLAPTTPPTNTTTLAPTTPVTTTTLAPTTPPTNTTTLAPTTEPTNATTLVPTTTTQNATNSTTVMPTPTTTPTIPPVPNPTVGNYSLKPDVNSSACLLAKMGLQFSFKASASGGFQTINLKPNMTSTNGTCGSGGRASTLVLKSEDIEVNFVFTNVSAKFRLHEMTLLVALGNESFFKDSNTNLSLWEASVGSSYMCRKELSYNISDKLVLNTFELQVQPFAVQKDVFSTVEDCDADSPDSYVVPIAVGIALAVLVVIVIVAYLIGRKKNQLAGYQQFN